MMLRYFSLVLCLTALSLAPISAQQLYPANAISAKVLTVDYGSPNSLNLDRGYGLELAYQRIISDYFNLAFPFQVQVANVPGFLNNINIINLDANIQFFPFKTSPKISPYVLAGGGLSFEDFDDVGFQIPLGGGLNVRLGENGYANIQGAYRLSGTELRDNYQWGVGYVYRFPNADADGDGVLDTQDKCPELPGDPINAGCPDTDEDGIIDIDDECPLLAGAESTGGCPDLDKDGVVDNQDNCPLIPGQLNGCPDGDNDGIADKDDACPGEPGPVNMQGCPDNDRDGLHNGIDQCPDQPGPAETNGCPQADSDKDGLPDDVDACPEIPGPPNTKGCPDGDNDGIADKDDRCPKVPGPYAGCPDTDGDGVHDGDDRCPNEKGLLSNKGCPEIEDDIKDVLETAMQSVQFESGSASLKTSSNAILDQIAQIMADNPAYSLIIAGHTDNTGDEVANQILSQQRAQTCYQYLADTGVSSRRMSYAGYGQSQPLASNDTVEGRRLNRRVEFDLIIR